MIQAAAKIDEIENQKCPDGDGSKIAGELRRKEYRLKKLQEAKELLERERTYDTVRPHQVLSYLTPLKFLEQWKEKENQGKQGVYFAYLSNFV